MKKPSEPGPKKVRVAELKARLSHYLRLARAGETLTVCDRDTPVAQIVPYRVSSESFPMTIREPAPGSPKLHEIPIPPMRPLDFDIVDILLWTRGEQ